MITGRHTIKGRSIVVPDRAPSIENRYAILLAPSYSFVVDDIGIRTW
jgi:hypothetical protein